MSKKKIKRGRPEVEESTKSFSVSIKPSEKKTLEKKYGSLTLAIKSLL